MFKVIKEKNLGSSLGKQEIDILTEVIKKKNALTRGPYLEKFEKIFAKMCGSKYAVAVSSCTAALKISAQLLRLKQGDEVIVQANAFWKTVVALVERKVLLKIVDVNKNNFQMSFEDLQNKITKKTRAVYLVTMGGSTDNIEKIHNFCKNRNIPLIQDCAHSVFYKFNNKPPGNYADINCFSFSTLKNITTLGEGGMITMDREIFADEAKKLRDGWPIGKFVKYEYNYQKNFFSKPINTNFLKPGDYFYHDWKTLEEIGSTYKMNDAQAAVGIVQLKKLQFFLKKRQEISNLYNNFLKKYSFFKLQKYSSKLLSSYHLYSFFVEKNNYFDRDHFVERLEKKYNLILTNRYWPIHMHPILRLKKHKIGEAKNFEEIYFKKQIDLPISAIMPLKEAREVIKRLKICVDSFRKDKNN
jgi:perosamine synthetase